MYFDFGDKEILFSDELATTQVDIGGQVKAIKNKFYHIQIPGSGIAYDRDGINRSQLRSHVFGLRRFLVPKISNNLFLLASVVVDEPNTLYDFDITLPEAGTEHVIGIYNEAGTFKYIYDGVLVDSKNGIPNIDDFEFLASSNSMTNFIANGDTEGLGVTIHNMLFSGCRVFNVYVTNSPIDKYKQDRILVEVGRRVSLGRYSIVEDEYTGPDYMFVDWWTQSITESTEAGWPY